MSSPDPFVQKALAKIASLEREEALLAAQQEGVQRRRNELQEQIVEWDRAKKLYVEAMGADAPAADPPAAEGKGPAVDAANRSIGDLTYEYISASPNGSAKITDVAAWLTGIGKLHSDLKNTNRPYGAVYTAILRNPKRFVKVGRGEYRIANSSDDEAPPLPA
jgi:hypothetical protein